MRIVVMEHITLDGVMQGPGREDEDRRGGFDRGGWATARSDEVVGGAMGARMGSAAGLLFGRRTYEDVLGHWNRTPDNPFVEPLNAMQKWVVSNTLAEPLPWPNSTLLPGDPASAVHGLDVGDDALIGIMGSGQLVRSLAADGLIDEWLLFVHPVVLGTGRRLFPDDGPALELELVEAVTATTGVVVASYRPAD